jgi:lysozyme family protein
MSVGDFPKALPRILVYEGGKANNPKDPGGRTNKGITQGTYNAYRRQLGKAPQDVYLISDAEVATIYQLRYWNVMDCDSLPAGLDLAVFDGGVNSGPGQSGKWLQHALGDKFSGTVDGLMGPKTLQAIEDYGDVEKLIGEYCSRRLATLHSLTTWKTFGPGWSARIANVLKTSDAWAVGAEAPHPVDVTAAGGHMKAHVSDLKVSKISQASAHATTAATGFGAVATSAVTNFAPVQAAMPNAHWLAYVLGFMTISSTLAGYVAKVSDAAHTQAEKGSATAAVDLDADSAHPQVAVNDNAAPAVTFDPDAAKLLQSTAQAA